jgi:glucose/arabinose dehydrogenase
VKHRFFFIFSALVILGFVAFLVVAWPYRGFVPLVTPSPISVTTTTPTVAGKNTTGLPLKLPEGFSIDIFAKDVKDARVIAMDPNGTPIVSLTSVGRVVALTEPVTTVLDHLHSPHGLAFKCDSSARCQLYVAETNAVSEYDYDATTRKATKRKKLFDLPNAGFHFTRTLQFLSDGRLLVMVGSDCNICHETDPLRAAASVWDGKELKSFAAGLRNSVFVTPGPNGQTWATEMGRDSLGDDIPPDEINILEEGKNFGWPNCYGQNIHDTQFDKNTYIRNPCMEPFETPSHIDIPAHSAPLGLVFVPANSAWPKEYWGNLLVAYHGSWNRTVPTGYKIRRFVLDANGNVTHDEDFISGWLTPKGDVLGRPVGLAFDAHDDLYVSDDRLGVVYRVTPPTR